MCRQKTELELAEDVQGEARRLRIALFEAYHADTWEEAKRIAMCAMSGELHGHEPAPGNNGSFLRAFSPASEGGPT